MGVKKVVHTVCTKCAQNVQNSKSVRVKNQPLFTSFRGWLWAPGYRSTGKNDGQSCSGGGQKPGGQNACVFKILSAGTLPPYTQIQGCFWGVFMVFGVKTTGIAILGV